LTLINATSGNSLTSKNPENEERSMVETARYHPAEFFRNTLSPSVVSGVVTSNPLFGFFLAIALICLALVSLPDIVGVRTDEQAVTAVCPMVEVALDQGYGVSRSHMVECTAVPN
jgi:hypothetical protein